MKDYYREIDEAIKRYEEYRYATRNISWITNRIDWCWKFRKISREQMNELSSRITEVINSKHFDVL